MLARKENPRSNILAPSKLKLFPQSRNSLEKGFEKFVGKTPSYTCMKHALKCKSMFTLKATRELPDNKKLSNLRITPIKSLFFKIPYACISTTSIARGVTLFCSFHIPGEQNRNRTRRETPFREIRLLALGKTLSFKLQLYWYGGKFGKHKPAAMR